MTIYSGNRVLTVKELSIGDAMHCGTTANRCMVWRVIDKDETYAYIKVGGTTIKMSGRDIRNDLPMYRSDECPNCSTIQAESTTSRPGEPITFTTQAIEAANIRSALSRVDNVRRKNELGSGGARMANQKSYIAERARQIIDKLKEGAR